MKMRFPLVVWRTLQCRDRSAGEANPSKTTERVHVPVVSAAVAMRCNYRRSRNDHNDSCLAAFLTPLRLVAEAAMSCH